MKIIKNQVIPVILATVWISISEFVRNQIFLLSFWEKHYASLGLVFPTETVNGALWGVWSLMFAVLVFILSKKFYLFQTTVISWFAGFVLMWFVIGNMGVMPIQILYIAIPLSFVEALIASFIVFAFKEKKKKTVENAG